MGAVKGLHLFARGVALRETWDHVGSFEHLWAGWALSLL